MGAVQFAWRYSALSHTAHRANWARSLRLPVGNSLGSRSEALLLPFSLVRNARCTYSWRFPAYRDPTVPLADILNTARCDSRSVSGTNRCCQVTEVR